MIPTRPTQAIPPFLLPFVLPVEPVEPVREGAIDWYQPLDVDSGVRCPAVVFVHGGPVPDFLEPKPREWPSYRAYGAWAARAGLLGVMFDHGFASIDAFGRAQSDIQHVLDTVRARPGVDPDRIVLWGFSGAGVLLGRWIRERPTWLRGVAASYPCCRPLVDVPEPPVSMTEAVGSAADLPLLLTRVGLEREEVAETVAEFVAAARAARARLDIVDVPHGHHGFDQLDNTPESRAAVREAMDWVEDRLR